MRAPTTANYFTKNARKGSNGNGGRKKLHSDGNVDARRGGWSVSRGSSGWVMAGGRHERFAYVMSCPAAEHNDSKPQTTTTTLLFAAPFRADDTHSVHARSSILH